MEYYNEELFHSGIKGMKWGVRRYQNPDGSLTPAGRKHYGSGKSIGERIKAYKTKKQRQKNLEKAREARAAKVEEKKTLEEQRAKLLKSNDAKEIYANRHLLTTAELNDRINRIDTEARLASKIVEDKQQTGIDYVNSKMQKATNTINNVTNLYRSVDNAYSSVANSAIGKTLAKKLGIEPPKKEFNLAETWKNRNKLSDKEIQDLSQRLSNEQKIENIIKQREKSAEKQASKKGNSNDSNKKDKSSKETAEPKTEPKQDDATAGDDSKSSTKKSKKEKSTVEGKGTSKYTERKNDTVIDAEEGVDYWDVSDNSGTTSMSTVTNSNSYSLGQNYVSALLEDRSGR